MASLFNLTMGQDKNQAQFVVLFQPHDVPEKWSKNKGRYLCPEKQAKDGERDGLIREGSRKKKRHPDGDLKKATFFFFFFHLKSVGVNYSLIVFGGIWAISLF